MIFDGVLSRYGTSILLKSQYGYWGLQILMAWQQIGYMMIIYIAGLQAVPEDILEAARIDGANAWQTLWKVTIPNVMPSITICTFLSLTNGFKLYDQNLALTGGSPFKTLADGKTNRVICARAGQMVDIDITEGLSMKKGLNEQQYEVLQAMTGIDN